MNGELVVVDDVAAAFRDLLVERNPRILALCGGGTARACYETLAQRPQLDWSDVDVLFGDERWVPVDHEESNEGMARRVLLDGVPVKEIHSVREAGPTIEAAADAYDRLVADLPGIDVMHLGLGEDGHTASLFPGSPATEVTDRFVVPTEHHDWERVTFTYPGIATARLVVVTATGASKADALRRVREGDLHAPAARIDAESVVWLADPPAAGWANDRGITASG